MATSFKNMPYDVSTFEKSVYGVPSDSHAIINSFYVGNFNNGGLTITIEVKVTTDGSRNYVANSTNVFTTTLDGGQYLNLLTGPLVLEGGDSLVFTSNTTGRVEGTIAAMQVNREDQETTPTGSV
mgnify:CR=1 FL=1|jgi:hypothetical protein